MRPQSITLFDYFYLGSMFLGLLGFITSYSGLTEELARQSAATGIAVPSAVIIVGYVIGVIIGLALWYLVSRKRWVLAKWLIVLFFLLSLTGVGSYFVGPMPLHEIYGLIALIAQAVAVGLLFRADARAWLAGDDTPRDI